MQQATPFRYYDARQARLEAECLRQRRGGSPDSPAASPDIGEEEARRAVAAARGLALSGGGIRSATFSLGLLRALARAGRLKEFDFLSTVSGGGYVGAFLGRLYRRAAEPASDPQRTPAQAAQEVEQVLASDAAPVLRWLRDNGRYLAPRGLKDRLFAVGIYCRNLLSTHVLLGISLLTAFLGWAALRIGLPELVPAAAVASRFGYLPDGTGLSPAWLLALLFAVALLCSAWAYWMHRDAASLAWEQRIVAAALALLAALALWEKLPAFLAEVTGKLPPELLFAALVLGAGALAAAFAYGLRSPDAGVLRHRLSVALRVCLAGLLASALFALLDDGAYRAFHALRKAEAGGDALVIGAGLTGALLAGLRALAQNLASRLEARGKGAGRGLGILVGGAGVLLLALLAFGWAYAAQAFVWSGLPRGSVPQDAWPVLGAALALGLLVVLAGRHLDVLNLSSLHTFYAARLTRAYLGPGNGARGLPFSPEPAHAGAGFQSVSRVVAGDDVAFGEYAPHRHGGPLHLVNANVNQTRYSAGGDFQPDRKGWNLAAGPAGFNLGRSRWESPAWPQAQPLGLGQWVAISGAAFTTGAGPRTGLGFSALLGLLGVRLGFWWRAGADSRHRPAPHMLRALWQEIAGAFDPDASSHWYLSDGGHFENTGAYELVRRRLKRIVVADCGADPQYGFDDLAGLVRKARIDFGAEIQFFGKGDLDGLWKDQPELRALFAEPEAMQGRQGPGLLLALVRYPHDPEPGWMVVVKPRLPAQLPADLTHYAQQQPEFPQQTTLDQFYDEAQWESTHKLGCLLGEQLARALAALPAWRDGSAPAPAGFAGAAGLAAPAGAPPADAPAEAGTPAGLLKVYAPIILALWTGFEFYSNYKQEQAKEAAETTKLALARIDTLERQVFGKEGCAASPAPLEACPTASAQLVVVGRILGELPPSSAKPLNDIKAKLEEALGIRKPPRAEAVALASAPGTPAQALKLDKAAPPAPPAPPAEAALARALVYVQIYDEERRADAKQMIENLRQAGLTSAQLPGVENVVRTAQASGAKAPARLAKLTAIYYHPEDRPLAEWIAGHAVADGAQAAELRDLSGRFANVRKGLIELWLP